MREARERGLPATHLVIGLAPDGGRLSPRDRRAVLQAIDLGLHVDSGLHDFLGEERRHFERRRARPEPGVVAECCEELGEAMRGIEIGTLKPEEQLATRGW